MQGNMKTTAISALGQGLKCSKRGRTHRPPVLDGVALAELNDLNLLDEVGPSFYGRWVYTDDWGWYWIEDPSCGVASKPGRNSPMAGRSGSAIERAVVVTRPALSFQCIALA